MAQLVIPAAGAAVGWFVGGSTGATIGWTIGSALTSEKQNINMPQVGDLRVQTSGYGQPVPFCVGTQRVAGNIFWAADKEAHQVTQRTGGKGGFAGGTETTVTTYSISMAVSICVGPISGIKRCWMDGTLVAEAGTGQANLPGVLYLGDYTQNPDPTMVSVQGSGNVPDYRGMAYMVLTDFDLGASGRVPQFSFEVVGATL